MSQRQSFCPKRVVLKIGSRLLTRGQRSLDEQAIGAFVDAVARHRNTQTVIVSSGAVAAGYPALGLQTPPTSVATRQAAAAVGQAKIMQLYAGLFEKHGISVGQVLLTNDGLVDRQRYLNALHALRELFDANVIPIVNENDTVSVEEIKVGDNDNLAAHTAALVDADLLVLLTDINGVYTTNPKTDPAAQLISYAATPAELAQYTWAKEALESTGGMTTKLEAARKAASYGIPTIICNGEDVANIDKIYHGEEVGTWIDGSASPLRPRQHWIVHQKTPPGGVILDDGAVEAVVGKRRSLLARGIADVFGQFAQGDVISILNQNRVELARGIAGYASLEVAAIKGQHSDKFEEILGYIVTKEVIHADDIVLMEQK